MLNDDRDLPSRCAEPSYEMQHLLLIEGKLSSGDLDITASTQFLPNESVLSNWKVENQYYYKSMASVQLLRQVCLHFHKDFSLEQVNRSASFLNHLVLVQQEQRSVAYGFSRHLERLRKCMLSLKDLDSKSAVVDHETGCDLVTPNQHAINKCMWQQKIEDENPVEKVLVMTVEPGFGGQTFMPEMMDKVRALESLSHMVV
ncbi:PREDICTED: uncharacterized protein LOC104593847 isoform X2 [Nelumbo nucifera]|uniref:Uncharacterized protein LOC104593847 isoform X2 n=1 Tax=Nelumbo nucifera TaxID=4432 RepID=A0A1U7ZGS6_NELNU|nr:PREDICTED: uncharacterized protein LOC104593847 isoform X2 [Nelumbo nucifera]